MRIPANRLSMCQGYFVQSQLTAIRPMSPRSSLRLRKHQLTAWVGKWPVEIFSRVKRSSWQKATSFPLSVRQAAGFSPNALMPKIFISHLQFSGLYAQIGAIQDQKKRWLAKRRTARLANLGRSGPEAPSGQEDDRDRAQRGGHQDGEG